ncbi:phosphoribosylformylglycinamidine synthase, partial [human gut metagenome]
MTGIKSFALWIWLASVQRYLKKRGFVNNLDESEEINACSIEVPVQIDGKTEQWLVQFKNETHNHP